MSGRRQEVGAAASGAQAVAVKAGRTWRVRSEMQRRTANAHPRRMLETCDVQTWTLDHAVHVTGQRREACVWILRGDLPNLVAGGRNRVVGRARIKRHRFARE